MDKDIIQKKKIWLDCDTGNDDTFAIILAGRCQKLELLGISTVFGNHCIENTTLNTLKILSLINLHHIKVYPGANKPLNRILDISKGEECHSSSGLALSEFIKSPLKQKSNKTAVMKLKKVLQNSAQKITLCCTGSLTNIANLISQFPEVLHNIEKIVIMGGCLSKGNVTQYAEYNIWLDPEAADIVFKSGLDIVLNVLELTHQCIYTEFEQRRLIGLKSDFVMFLDGVLNCYRQAYKEIHNFENPPLHDPTTIAYVLLPSIFEGNYCTVEVEKQCEIKQGKLKVTVNENCIKGNILINTKINAEKFWDLMLTVIEETNAVYNKQQILPIIQ